MSVGKSEDFTKEVNFCQAEDWDRIFQAEGIAHVTLSGIKWQKGSSSESLVVVEEEVLRAGARGGRAVFKL